MFWSKFFVIPTLNVLRKFMMPDMSISLKVVSMAQVFWASLRRSAIRMRIRFIFTRRSPRLPPLLTGAAAGIGCKQNNEKMLTHNARQTLTSATGVLEMGWDAAASTFGAAAGMAVAAAAAAAATGAKDFLIDIAVAELTISFWMENGSE